MATSINTAEIPVSIVASATAASYTVPSDRYAVVRAQVSDTGSISVNGVLVLGAYSWSAINSSNGLWRMPGSPSFTNNLFGTNDGYMTGMLAIGGVAVGAASGASFMNTAASVYPALAGAGTASNSFQWNRTAVSANATTSLVNVFANSTASETSNHTFKVPAGSIIVGSGTARYLIELYRIPGSAT